MGKYFQHLERMNNEQGNDPFHRSQRAEIL